MSLSQVRRFNAAVTICRRYRLSEDIALLMYQCEPGLRYSTIYDENKYESKDHLFISKTTIMVNKRETIYFIISVSDKQLSSFFISLILSLFSYIFFFPYHFCFNFVVSERNLHIIFCRHIWAELSRLFWTFLSGTFFPGGGGGARAPSAPILRTRLIFL